MSCGEPGGAAAGDADPGPGLAGGARGLPEDPLAAALDAGEHELGAVLARAVEHEIDRDAAALAGADRDLLDDLGVLGPALGAVAVDLRGPRPAVARLEHELAVGSGSRIRNGSVESGSGLAATSNRATRADVVMRLCLGVEPLEQPVEDLQPPDLALVGGVVALALEGGAELERGLEVGAGFADRFEVAVQPDGAGAVAVAEHPPVHLCAELAHLGPLRVAGSCLGAS